MGGLLIHSMSFANAVLSIVIGYTVLTVIFIVYGGLGFSRRQQSGLILGNLFGPKIGKFVVPTVLALGQIGWASFNIKFGGESLAEIVHIPTLLGYFIYTATIIFIASLGLAQIGIIKWGITLSSLGLVALIFFSSINESTFDLLLHGTPHDNHSLFWGVSVVVASFISFASVSPDFFSQVQRKKDVYFSSIFGVFFPGVLILFTGCILFAGNTGNDLVALVGSLSFPLLAQIFNVTTNTDGSTAIYTPALKLRQMFKIKLNVGVFIAGLTALALTVMGLGDQLELWLKMLSIFSPAFIGCALASWILKEQKLLPAVFGFSIAVFAAVCVTPVFPPVFISLVVPFLIVISFESTAPLGKFLDRTVMAQLGALLDKFRHHEWSRIATDYRLIFRTVG